MRRVLLSAAVLTLAQTTIAEAEWSREMPVLGPSAIRTTGIAMRPIPGSPTTWQPAIVYFLPDNTISYAERQPSGAWIIQATTGFTQTPIAPIPLTFTSTGDPRFVYAADFGGPEGGLIYYVVRDEGIWSLRSAGGFGDKPTLALDPGTDAVHIAHWYVPAPGAPPRIRYLYGTDEMTWTPTPVPAQSHQSVDLPSLDLDFDGVAHIAFKMTDPLAPIPHFLRLANSNGLVPTPEFVNETVANEPQPVANIRLEHDPTTGGPVIAFTEVGTTEPLKTYLLVRSKDLGVWLPNVVVDSALIGIQNVDFAIDSQGTLHLVYEAIELPVGPREVRYAHRTQLGTFIVEVVRVGDDANRYPHGCSVAVDPTTLTPSAAYLFQDDFVAPDVGTLIRAERGSTVDVPAPAVIRAMRTAVKPNPFQGAGRPVVVLSAGGEMLVEGDVFDLNGRRVSSVGPALLHPGINEMALDLDGLGNGVYLVGLRSGTEVWEAKVVVMK